MSRNSIYHEIEKERIYQEGKWGNDADDVHCNPNDWVAFISKYSSKWQAGELMPLSHMTIEAFRTSMIKTAALAVAAIESLDRQTQQHGKPFYEK
jgi:hypothetical protein